MKTIQKIKPLFYFEVIPLSNADDFFTARQCNPVGILLKSLKELVFHDWSCIFKCRKDIYSFFLTFNTLRTIASLFLSNNFQSSFPHE